MKNAITFSVVIPTRNREASLGNLLSILNDQTLKPHEIIIVDSSDKKICRYDNPDDVVKYIHTSHKSSAMQRNIGMRRVVENTQVLFFLDDDTSPYPKYFEDMINTLISFEAIGVSGLAINADNNERSKPSGFLGFLKKIAFLDSDIDGKLLSSGVGIPVRKSNSGVIEVQWLIGCSCWDYQTIKELEFESDFKGYSLGEDVIFSVRARQLGKLFVNSNIVLNHMALPQVDQSIIKFNYMWVYYRFRIRKYISKKIIFYFTFFLSVLAKFFFSCTTLIMKPISSVKKIVGLTFGLIRIFSDIFKK